MAWSGARASRGAAATHEAVTSEFGRQGTTVGTLGRSQPAIVGRDQPASVETNKRCAGDTPTVAESTPSTMRGIIQGGLEDRALALLVLAVAVFNVLDAALTLALVRAGLADEANPVMAASLSAGPTWFLLHKVVLVGGGLTVLWFTRRRKLAQMGLVLCSAAYGLLTLVHVWSCKLLLQHYLW